jgi:MFS family permease
MLGVCNFLAPGIWGAMNSLGGGGSQSPWLVNSANALTFVLMVVTCAFSSIFVKYLSVKWTLILGAAGYCPYAAGLYCNNRFGSDWFVLLGAALCGLGAGIFWSAEAAIALAYPEPENQGRFLGFWLSFRVMGQILGGAINLGLNVERNQAGSVSYTVFLIFIALQALAPFAGFLISNPSQVQRTDGVLVSCSIPKSQRIVNELTSMGRLFINKKFLMIVPLIAQAVFAEAVFFTYAGLWFSVRARALGSFLAGVIALASGNALGAFLDNKKLSLKTRSRWSFGMIMTTQGAWWLWGVIVATEFRKSQPTFDWVDSGFGKAFAWFIFQVLGFQLNYMFA